MIQPTLSLFVIPNVPIIVSGDNLAEIIVQSLKSSREELKDGDILCVAQKVVSKAEGRVVDLATVDPSPAAVDMARKTQKDPRMVELILREASKVIRYKPGVLIVEHHSGVILANAGIDHSNVGDHAAGELVTMLPKDANASAARLRVAVYELYRVKVGVIITDSVGRPWRNGTVGIALGSTGIRPIRDLRGHQDLFGRKLLVSETADVDGLAAAACLVMREAGEATPVVLIRGFEFSDNGKDARALLRPEAEDLFR